MVRRTSDYILVVIRITIWPWWRFVQILPSVILLECPDRGAGDDWWSLCSLSGSIGPM